MCFGHVAKAGPWYATSHATAEPLVSRIVQSGEPGASMAAAERVPRAVHGLTRLLSHGAEAAARNPALYELLVLFDAVRGGARAGFRLSHCWMSDGRSHDDCAGS